MECYNKNHRTITRYTHEVTYKTEQIMSTEDGIGEYSKRSKTVEVHNSIFKRIYHYDNILITGLKRVKKT